MKLYATTTSERASKGQGGNDKLIVEFSANGGKDKICSIEMKMDHDMVRLFLIETGGIISPTSVYQKNIENLFQKAGWNDNLCINGKQLPKGKRQKDEKWCDQCMSHGCKQL